MKTATVTLKISKVGSTVVRENVTPAEMMYLAADHKNEAGGKPILEVKETGDVERDEVTELNRLLGKYIIKKVKALFPGIPPKFPETFEQAQQWGLMAELPTERLLDHKLA